MKQEHIIEHIKNHLQHHLRLLDLSLCVYIIILIRFFLIKRKMIIRHKVELFNKKAASLSNTLKYDFLVCVFYETHSNQIYPDSEH